MFFPGPHNAKHLDTFGKDGPKSSSRSSQPIQPHAANMPVRVCCLACIHVLPVRGERADTRRKVVRSQDSTHAASEGVTGKLTITQLTPTSQSEAESWQVSAVCFPAHVGLKMVPLCPRYFQWPWTAWKVLSGWAVPCLRLSSSRVTVAAELVLAVQTHCSGRLRAARCRPQ
jgi:hypothetical protein